MAALARVVVLLLLSLASATALALQTCDGERSKTESWVALLATGAAPSPVLRVGTSGDYAPFSLQGRGFDVDVAEAMARDLRVRIEWIPFRWETLSADARAGRFDIAMSGVTWLPERAVRGYLTRAVAAGGPCLLGAERPRRLAVNRGGALERWARAAHPHAEVIAVDDNRALPGLLAAGRVDAIATDRFELPHFREGLGGHRPAAATCEPPRDRKVYWVTGSPPDGLGPRVDDWLERHEPELRRLRERHFGAAQPRDATDHLIDLLARRFALMPHVGAWKRARGLPLADPAREARVVEQAERSAREHGLDASGVGSLFAVLVELAKQVQARAPRELEPALDLSLELRPELDRLGGRLVHALAAALPLEPDHLSGARMAPLEPWLEPPELERLRAALLALRARAS